MKVLHVINSLILAGVEVLLAEMVPRFRARGLEVEVAVLKPLDSPLEHRLRDSGIPFLQNSVHRIYSPAHVFSLARRLHEFDLVQSYLFPAQLWVASAAVLAKRRVPLVTTEQSTQTGRRNWWFHPADRWMYSRYRAIACNSPETLESLVRWVPGAESRVSVIPNGVALDRMAGAQPPPRSSVLPDDGSPLLMFVARLEPAKDHATLLRALAQVPSTRLALVGDGVLRGELEALAASLGIRERVHFLGRRADVPQLLKLADVYVHSSHWEGFGIAAVEAMAAGVPVIASDVPGLGQVVGSAGLLFPAGDAECLAKHIRSLLDSEPLRRRLSQAGKERARSFSIEGSVEAYISLYESVLAEERSGRAPTRTS
jgi:glycosyltransferase involved in cell wall biosynthesis